MTISDGTVTATSGSKTIVFTGGKLLDKGVKAGDWFKIDGEEKKYHFELTPTDNINGQLVEEYGGVTQANVTYQIFTDFTSLGLAILTSAVQDGWTLNRFNFELLEDILAAAGITGLTSYRKLPLFYAGLPEQGREFGQIKLASDTEMVEIGILAESPPDADVSLDIAIAGVYQAVSGLTLPASSFSFYKTVALNGSAGDVINMKFTSVQDGVFPGSNYTVWLKYKDISSLEKRYEFIQFSPGMAEVSKRIGRGFKPAVKSRFFAGMIRAQSGVPLGADLKIALMHNDAQQAQILTLAAGTTSQYTSFAQLDVLTTETIDSIITQIGSDFPGADITVTLYSYKIT